MTHRRSITRICVRHPDEEAHVLCRRHNRLLCVGCGLERASAPDCSIVEIKKIFTERQRLLVENLAIKQLAEYQKRLIERNETYTESLNSNLVQQVLDLHFRLTKRLDKLKDDCLAEIDTQTGVITKSNQQYIQRLSSVAKTANQNISKLSNILIDDINNIKLTMEEVKADLNINIPKRDSKPEAEFKPNDFLCMSIFQEDTSLGHVIIIDDDDYNKIGEFPKLNLEGITKEPFKCKKLNDGEIRQASTCTKDSNIHTKVAYCVRKSSDEVFQNTEDDYDLPFLCPPDETTCRLRNDDRRRSDTASKHQSKSDLNAKQSDDAKKLLNDRRVKSFDGLSVSLPSKIKVTEQQGVESSGSKISPDYFDSYCNLLTGNISENMYNGIEFDFSKSITPEYYMNKTVAISAIKPHFSSACKFCKLVHLGGSLIGLLSKMNNSVVVVGLDGTVHNKKTMISGLVNITAVEKNKMALLVENGHQVCIVDVNSVGCPTTDWFLVHEHFQNITGFDYDASSSQFAISSSDKLAILDKTGHVLFRHNYLSTTNTSSDMVSVYNFQKGCLYILNVQNKSVKCFDCKKGDIPWRCKYEDSSFMPRSLCLYNDTICIACRDVIIQLFAEDGSHFMTHDAKSLLEDSLGVCVIDDFVVYTSNSNDFEKSTKLAYRKLL